MYLYSQQRQHCSECSEGLGIGEEKEKEKEKRGEEKREKRRW
jgi:hypothetical protein